MLGTQRQKKGDKQHQIYMAVLGFRVGGNANFRVCVGGNTNFSVFRYQHVGIGNATLWHWGSKPTPGPNGNGFASQCNIGFKLY